MPPQRNSQCHQKLPLPDRSRRSPGSNERSVDRDGRYRRRGSVKTHLQNRSLLLPGIATTTNILLNAYLRVSTGGSRDSQKNGSVRPVRQHGIGQGRIYCKSWRFQRSSVTGGNASSGTDLPELACRTPVQLVPFTVRMRQVCIDVRVFGVLLYQDIHTTMKPRVPAPSTTRTHTSPSRDHSGLPPHHSSHSISQAMSRAHAGGLSSFSFIFTFFVTRNIRAISTLSDTFPSIW